MTGLGGGAAIGSAGAAGGSAPPAPARHRSGFAEFLHCLNPLQYIPVVGSIYRAVTGDTIPEAVREAGSLVVSGLTGGPIGVAIGVGTDLAERALGFDQEKFSQQVLASLGIGHGAAAAPAAGATRPGAASSGAAPPSAATEAAIAALQTQVIPLSIPQGTAADADMLNGMELARLAHSSYGRAAALPA